MSYIVAFVKFSKLSEEYPVECFRTDILKGDSVLVKLADRPLKPALVVDVQFLNWASTGKIKCKLNEAIQRHDWAWDVENTCEVSGFTTNEVFVKELLRLGWRFLHKNSTYQHALTTSNASQSANILVRKNGIDIQFFLSKENLYLSLLKSVKSLSRLVAS